MSESVFKKIRKKIVSIYMMHLDAKLCPPEVHTIKPLNLLLLLLLIRFIHHVLCLTVISIY